MGFGTVTGDGCDCRHSTANRATIIDVTATAPAPRIIIVDCLCFSCLEISVGGSSDKMVSSEKNLTQSSGNLDVILFRCDLSRMIVAIYLSI